MSETKSVEYKIFDGESAQEALKKAREYCGDNARVISTTQVKKATINSSALFQVTVLLDNTAPKEETNQKTDITNIKKDNFSNSEDVLLNISKAAKQISRVAEVTSNKSKLSPSSFPNSVQFPSEELKVIKNEISKLADKIQNIQHMIWEDDISKRGYLDIPPEFAEIYKLAHQSGMGAAHLDSIMRTTLKHMPTNMKHSPITVKRFFKTLLRRMVPTRTEINIVKNQQKVMMLIGPTGVGKTTTLAKLAARFAYLKEARHKVGIITLDTYRIGATEQLFKYASMMRLQVEDVVGIGDFENALMKMKNCDLILIDTTGNSPYDKEKIAKLNHILKNSSTEIDVSLVLSAGSKLDDLLDIYENYSSFDIDTLIFTKFDETKVFGNIFSLVYSVQKPISYISIGQEVPNDLEVASSDFIVSCMLDGFRKEYGKSSE